MARRRRRKKRQQREAEALQGELLAQPEVARGSEQTQQGQASRAASDPVPEEPRAEQAAGATAPPADTEGAKGELGGEPSGTPPPLPGASLAGGFADRWVRAVGRRGPVSAPEPEERRPNGEEIARALNGLELHEPARDHAAATAVRPAGEPLARAKELVQHGRVHEAIDLYLGILTVNPANLKAHNNLGVLLDELRQYEAAIEHFQAAEEIAPENVEVLTNFASTLTSVARYDQAEALLRRAQRIDADSLQAKLAIGILYFRRGLYGQAETELAWVCARDRNNGAAFYYRGEALNRLGRFEDAGQAMERAKLLLPEDPRPYYTLGHLYDRKHQPEEAAEMYRQARRLQSR